MQDLVKQYRRARSRGETAKTTPQTETPFSSAKLPTPPLRLSLRRGKHNFLSRASAINHERSDSGHRSRIWDGSILEPKAKTNSHSCITGFLNLRSALSSAADQVPPEPFQMPLWLRTVPLSRPAQGESDGLRSKRSLAGWHQSESPVPLHRGL